MLYAADNLRDFYLHFGGCYVAERNLTGDYTVYKVGANRERREEAVPLQQIYGPDRKRISRRWEEVVELFELVPLNLGLLNTEFSVAYVTKIPAKQYYKGFNAGSYSITYLGYETWSVLKPPPVESVAHACFNNKYTPIKETMDGIREGKFLGRAISPNYGIYIRDKVWEMILVYKTKEIGYLVDSDVVAIPQSWSPYISDIEKNTGLKATVIKGA
jgi:hypothetical protein